MKTEKVVIQVEMEVNLPITSEDVKLALEHMVSTHHKFNEDETTVTIPRVEVAWGGIRRFNSFARRCPGCGADRIETCECDRDWSGVDADSY